MDAKQVIERIRRLWHRPAPSEPHEDVPSPHFEEAAKIASGYFGKTLSDNEH